MRLSVRLSLVLVAVALVAVAGVAAMAWAVAAREVRGAVDDQLTEQADFVREATTQSGDVDDGLAAEVAASLDGPAEQPGRSFIDEERGVQAYDREGAPLGVGPDLWAGGPAGEGGDGSFRTVELDGRHYRVLEFPIAELVDGPLLDAAEGAGVATLQFYFEVTAQETALANLRVQLALVAALALALVGAVGWVMGGRLARPVRRLTDAAEELAALEDLPGRIEVDRTDEIGRLAASFNRMLAALEVAKEQQRRLVADASHELRTPLTSLRMRVEFLSGADGIDDAQRRTMLGGAVSDLEQLTALVDDLVDLAADVRSEEECPRPIGLGSILHVVADRTASATGRSVVVESDDATVVVRPGMIRRAVQNLADNAIKYSPEGPVVLRSRGPAIEVIDAGPGIADEEAALVFDRFYRSPKARSRPGNGIGLAIVKQVAEAHGGAVWVRTAEGGGARVGFSVGT